MEDDRGKFVLIAAGYKEEMDRFIQANPGLKSRFTHFLHLEDYSPAELYAIFESMVKQNGYELDAAAKSLAEEAIDEIHHAKGKGFTNGRTIRNLFDETKRHLASRLAELDKSSRTNIDIPYSKKAPQSAEAKK